MPYKNKEKNLESCRKWREKNKEKLKKEYKMDRDGIKTRKKLRCKKHKLFYLEYKLELKCQICGESHLSCLDFHHSNPIKKELNISNFSRYSFKLIKKEIEKCIVLCANCHRKFHWDDNKIEKLKNEIKDLELESNEYISNKIKKRSCKICGRNGDEIEFVKKRLFCKECYKKHQKNKMRERRKPKV